jgi:hypothetical protein
VTEIFILLPQGYTYLSVFVHLHFPLGPEMCKWKSHKELDPFKSIISQTEIMRGSEEERLHGVREAHQEL